MSKREKTTLRVLIASSHPLFGQGLRNLLKERESAGAKSAVQVVSIASNLEQALHAIDQHSPHLVIVDYDDHALNRDEFLARFVESDKRMRLVLISLQSGRDALIYDRHTLSNPLSASQITEWLETVPFLINGNPLSIKQE